MRLKDPRYRQKKVLQQFLHLTMIWLAVGHNFDFRIRISNYLDNIVLNLEQAVSYCWAKSHPYFHTSAISKVFSNGICNFVRY